MSGKRCLKKDCFGTRLGLGDGLPRLGLGALLVALRKVHGRRDEESGYASPLIVIEARIIAKAHATLWTKYARRVGARLGAVKHML